MDARALTVEFNEHINNGDLDGLAKLMTDDHTFIDTADQVIRGKRRPTVERLVSLRSLDLFTPLQGTNFVRHCSYHLSTVL